MPLACVGVFRSARASCTTSGQPACMWARLPVRAKNLDTYIQAYMPHESSGDSSVDQAGSERTEAGESAPSRLEDSPRPGRAKCELCETLQDLIMGAGEEASINLPCLLILAPSWMLGLPSPTRPSWRRRRGGHCANRPFCHSDGARDREERITWRCATKRPVSGLLRAALQPSS